MDAKGNGFLYFFECQNIWIVCNINYVPSTKHHLIAPTFHPVSGTKWRNYIQMEVKDDSSFLRNENPNKNVMFWVISGNLLKTLLM